MDTTILQSNMWGLVGNRGRLSIGLRLQGFDLRVIGF